MESNTFDLVSFIMQAESDGFDTLEEFYEGLQHMIDSGVVWQLQGSWGRVAAQAIEEGCCHV